MKRDIRIVTAASLPVWQVAARFKNIYSSMESAIRSFNYLFESKFLRIEETSQEG